MTTRARGGARAVSGLRADGEEFPVEASISQIEAGNQKLYTVVLRDITERKRDEERIREQAALLDQAREAIIVRDLQDRVVYWNRGAEGLFGWAADEAIGKNARDLPLPKRSDSGEIILSLERDRISLVHRSCDRDVRQTSDRRTRPDSQISVDGGRSGVGHRCATQDRKAGRVSQIDRIGMSTGCQQHGNQQTKASEFHVSSSATSYDRCTSGLSLSSKE